MCKPKTKHLLFVNYHGTMGGGQVHLLSLITGLPKEQFKISVLCCQNGAFIEVLKQNNIEPRIVPFPKGRRRYIWHVWPAWHKLSKILKAENIDLVLVSGIEEAKLSAGPCHKQKIPMVWLVQSLWKKNGTTARTYRILSRKTSQFIAVSEFMKKALLEEKIESSRIEVIHCSSWGPRERQSPSELKKRCGITPDNVVIGTTGIWRSNKGFSYFLQAADLVHYWHPKTIFFLGGEANPEDVSYSQMLLKMGRHLAAEKKLFFTGFHQKLEDFFSALDIFVLPSDAEPFGLVVLEAMTFGIPVIVTQSGGAQEIINHEQSGLLVPPQNAKSLADAMAQLVNNPAMRQKFGQAGQERAVRFFHPNAMFLKYSQCFQKILKS
jgi:glycosyltransferase involved in cell wall biosynthesis